MRTVLFAIASMAMTACLVGEVEPVDPGPGSGGIPGIPGVGGDAESLFTTTVAPIMRGCAGAPGACHVGNQAFPPPFLGTGPETEYYTALVGDVAANGNFQAANARLLLKLEAGPHQGLNYTPDQVATITAWLDAELLARNPDGTPPPGVNLLAEFSGCMNLEDWEAANMGAWATKPSSDSVCSACHGGGLSRFFANLDSTKMFEANKYEVFIGGFLAVGKDMITGEPAVVPAEARLVYIGSGEAGDIHPNFGTNAAQDPYFLSIVQFIQLTEARKVAGGCGPAEFPKVPLEPPAEVQQ